MANAQKQPDACDFFSGIGVIASVAGLVVVVLTLIMTWVNVSVIQDLQAANHGISIRLQNAESSINWLQSDQHLKVIPSSPLRSR